MARTSGRPFTFAGAPVNGTSGTKAGDPDNGPGKLLIDVTNDILYMNTNTKASPTWSAIGSAELASFLANVPTTAIAQVATANATDLASAIALVNVLKTTVNTLLTQLGSGAGGAGVLA